MQNLQWYPGHMAKTRRLIEANLKLIDVVVEILDARIPFSGRNPHFDDIIKNKPRLLVLNKADLADKLAYDPDRSKRRIMYPFVKQVFFDYNVMIGGSSSFDIVPGKYGKLNAIRRYLAENGMNEQEIIYCGDDYCEGGNDYDVYVGGIPFVKVDHYDRLGETLQDDGLL